MASNSWLAISPNVRARRSSGLVTLMSAISGLVRRVHARTRQRRHLFTLSDHQLRDIGLIRSDVELEWRKPFWRD
jgi:uncharacterized protein YjiS (DUF1127 family)